MVFGRLFARAVIQIRCEPDGSLTVRATGPLAPYVTRIQNFVRDEKMPAGAIFLTRGWQWRFPKHYDAGRQQQFRNFLGAECPVLPPGPQGHKRA
ncbi:MAG: hypothetical protein ACYTGX_05485 [Planctomycetota bacterium]|jgi:hypothetical protein